MVTEIKAFENLSQIELYQILKLRAQIFVVEQNCVYNDMDGLDIDGFHMFYKNNEQIIAYLRILKPGTRFSEVSIGRLVVDQRFRNKELGKKIMNDGIRFIQEELNQNLIKISAQKYLKKFYEKLGFEIVSEEYLEDGIPHFEMLWGTSSKRS